MSRARIVCLLPARNAAAELPGYLSSAERWCDAVVALDDGSTDETAGILAEAPLVERVLTNAPREGWEGWDDADNRRRLLEAAEELDPGWIAFVDADERLDPEDAEALREFLATEALPGCAYGLRHHRMWGDAFCDPRFDYVYRLFAYRPGLELPADRLHFHPVPVSIPAGARVRTTIRLKHFAAASEELLSARLEKYRAADPEGRYATNFGRLAEVPDAELLVPWERRPRGMPALEAVTARSSEEMPTQVVLERAYEGAYSLTQMLGLRAIRLIGRSLVAAVRDGTNHAARDDMALAATLAGMAFSNSGVALVHALEYPIGVLTHCSHGEGNGLLLPHVMRFNLESRISEFAKIAEALSGAPSENGGECSADRLRQLATGAIEQVERLQVAVGIRAQLRQLGLARERLPEVAAKAFQAPRHPREGTDGRTAFVTIAAQEARMFRLMIQIAEARDENARRFAVFVNGIASGQHWEDACCARAAKMVNQIMPQHAR